MKRRRPRAQGGPLATALVAAIGAAAVLAGGLGACGGSKDSGVADSKLPEGVRDETIDHERCEEGGNRIETLDANNDGKSDVRMVYAGKSSTKVCLVSDLNHDGRPDFFEYYDKSGVLRRREADYDDNGTVDAIEIYRDGKLAERELDTTGQHRIDTWEFYDPSGTLLRRERDTTNDGRIDQWVTFDAKHQTIAFDKNGDGKPDPANTVVLNLDGTPVDDDVDAATPLAAADAGAPSPATTPTLAAAPSDTLDAGAVDGGKHSKTTKSTASTKAAKK